MVGIFLVYFVGSLLFVGFSYDYVGFVRVVFGFCVFLICWVLIVPYSVYYLFVAVVGSCFGCLGCVEYI